MRGFIAQRPARTTGYTAGGYYGEQDAQLAKKTGQCRRGRLMAQKVTIGSCELWHGDCREILPAIAADAVITDPPYGIGVALGVTSKGSDGGMWANVKIAGDETTQVRDEALKMTANAKAHAVFASHKAPMPDGFRDLLIWDKGELGDAVETML